MPAADVTVGPIDMLGVRPRWGRTFSADDTQQTDVHVVVIAEAIARQRFADHSGTPGCTPWCPRSVRGIATAVHRRQSDFERPHRSRRETADGDEHPGATTMGKPGLLPRARIPLLAGRMFEPGDPATNVIITEALARRLWLDLRGQCFHTSSRSLRGPQCRKPTFCKAHSIC